MSDVNDKIQAAVKKEEESAEKFSIRRVVDDFVQSSVYYVEFESPNSAPEDCFYYALVDKNEIVTLFDDGVSAIEKLKDTLDKRRNFLQRLNEFTLVELIAAMMALGITLVFLILSLTQTQLNREFTGIFGIIVGYYFGKNTPSGN